MLVPFTLQMAIKTKWVVDAQAAPPKVSSANTPLDFREAICSALMFSTRQLVGIRQGN